MICPPELKARYNEKRLLPFVGAGVSMSMSWAKDGQRVWGPSWSDLVDQATEFLDFQSPELAKVRGTDLQILEYFKIKHSGQVAKLTNWFVKLMVPPDDDLKRSAIHEQLVRLEKCMLFYTTNFDDFLERAFCLHRRTCKVVAVEEQMGGTHQECEIVKFHGDVNHPDRIVLTESDYERRLSMSTAMDYRLRADLLGRVVLFVGYSFRDPNVAYLFRLFTDSFWQQEGALTGDRAYIIVPDPSDFELKLFEARRIRVIPLRESHFAEDTAKLLEEMRS